MTRLDVHQLIQPDTAVSKEADDGLISDGLCLLNQIFNLLTCKTRQKHLGHLRSIDSRDWIVLDVALPVQPVTEGSDGTVVGVLAVVAVEIGEESVDAGRRYLVVSSERFEAGFIELQCSW